MFENELIANYLEEHLTLGGGGGYRMGKGGRLISMIYIHTFIAS